MAFVGFPSDVDSTKGGNRSGSGSPDLTFVVDPWAILIPSHGCGSSGYERVVFKPNAKIKVFGTSDFANYTSLKSVCIPASVETIREYCFVWQPERLSYSFRSSSLQEITFEPESHLHVIESNYFMAAHRSYLFRLPASVSDLTGGSFAGSGISRIDVERGNRHFHVVGVRLMTLDNNTIIRYFGTEAEVLVPKNVKCLGESCFGECLGLQSIIIEAPVKFLPFECFHRCLALRSVTFAPGSRLARLDDFAFSGCEALDSIVIPSAIVALGNGCFEGCAKLVSIIFPPDSKLSHIASAAFAGCVSLSSFVVPPRESISLSCLTFASPSSMHEIRSLAPRWTGFIELPDTVTSLHLVSRASEPGPYTLCFGSESRLNRIRIEADPPEMPCRSFLRVGARSLKLFRASLEFAKERRIEQSKH
jgi:hypothetical protein